MPKLDITDLQPRSDISAKERGYPEGYQPVDSEKYMNGKQQSYFKEYLLQWRSELEQEFHSTVNDLKENSSIQADPNDQASLEYEQTLELRARDRERKLINKIDEALERIKEGSFGFCEESGEPIGLKRLMARPIATLSIEEKRRQEQKEIAYAD